MSIHNNNVGTPDTDALIRDAVAAIGRIADRWPEDTRKTSLVLTLLWLAHDLVNGVDVTMPPASVLTLRLADKPQIAGTLCSVSDAFQQLSESLGVTH